MARALDEIKKDLATLVGESVKEGTNILKSVLGQYSSAELNFFSEFSGEVRKVCIRQVVTSIATKKLLLDLERRGEGVDLSTECSNSVKALTTVRLFEVAKDAILAYANYIDKAIEVMHGREYAALIDEYVAAGGERSDVD